MSLPPDDGDVPPTPPTPPTPVAEPGSDGARADAPTAPPPPPGYALPPYAPAQQQSYPGAVPTEAYTAGGYPGAPYPAGAPYAGAPYAGAPYGGAPYGGAPYGGVPVAPPNQPGKGLAITALVLGILGFLGALIPFGIFLAGLLLLAAVVLGIIALVRRAPGKPMAIAGIALGGLGLVAGIVSTVATVGFLATQMPTMIQQECERQGLSPEECQAIAEGSGGGQDPSDEPAGPGAAGDAAPLEVGTPFEVAMAEGTARVTVTSVTMSPSLPGVDQTPQNGAFLLVDMTWEVASGSLSYVDGYDFVELTNGGGDWFFGEYGFEGYLQSDALETGGTVQGLVAFDVDPAAGPFILEIYDEDYELAYRGQVPAT